MLISIFGFSSSLCDAWAAVAVSVTIVVFISPLSVEIYRKAQQLIADKAESERSVTIEGTETEGPMKLGQMA